MTPKASVLYELMIHLMIHHQAMFNRGTAERHLSRETASTYKAEGFLVPLYGEFSEPVANMPCSLAGVTAHYRKAQIASLGL